MKNYYEKFKGKTSEQLNNVFLTACEEGRFDEIKYLLSSPELLGKVNIHENDDYALALACEFGHIDIAKYLLTSSDLKEHSNIEERGNSILQTACENNDLTVLKLLFDNSEIKKYANYELMFHSAMHDENIEIAQYMIFELNIERDQNTIDYIANYKKSFSEKIENMFAMRELNKNLNQELPLNIENKKKPKL
jgi:ankyrin repeat protein